MEWTEVNAVRGFWKNKRFKVMCCLMACLALASAAAVYSINRYVLHYASAYIVPENRVPAADAILVLGAYVYPDGQVSPILGDRLETALEIYHGKKSPAIIVSGDHGRVQYDEVNAMKRYLMDRDVPDDRIFMDHAGFNTYESIFRAKAVFQVRKLTIVTQEYHLSRAVYIARKLGLEAYGVAADKRRYAGMGKYEAREIMARNKDFINATVKPRPTYLGEAIPVSGSGSLTNDK